MPALFGGCVTELGATFADRSVGAFGYDLFDCGPSCGGYRLLRHFRLLLLNFRYEAGQVFGGGDCQCIASALVVAIFPNLSS